MGKLFLSGSLISELRIGNKADAGVSQFFAQAEQQDAELSISVMQREA